MMHDTQVQCVEIMEILSHAYFWQKFRESNNFTVHTVEKREILSPKIFFVKSTL